MKIIALLFLAFAGIPSSELLAIQQPQAPDDKSSFWNDVFQKNHVVDIRIKLSKANWEKMQPQGFRGSNYEYVEADLVIDGEDFAKSGLRFKGNSSYRFSANSMKRPLKVDTNRFVETQKLHGRTKFNLSNSALDSAYMKEKLAYELYSKAGLPTPGVGWANVKLEVEGLQEETNLGLYVLIEQVDDKFLKRKLGKASKDSLLMKPEVMSWRYLGEETDVYSAFNIKSGEDDVEQIKKFASVLKLIDDGTDEQFAAQIGEKMDLDLLAGYLATTSLLSSLDSYVAAPHNYYLVMDKADGKLKLLPWDVNESFGTFTFNQDPSVLVNWNISKPYITGHRVLNRLFKTDFFPKLYRSKLEKLIKEDFTVEKINGRIAEYEKAILPFVQAKGFGELLGLQMGIEGDKDGINRSANRKIYSIQHFVKERFESVESQLQGKSKGQAIRGGFF